MQRIILAGVLGGIILFGWSAISWMVLPWHTQALKGFKDEKSIVEVIKSNAPISGIYFFPTQEPKPAEAEKTPVIFASVYQEGWSSMTPTIIKSLISQIIAAGLVAWLLTKTTVLSYASRILFIVTVAVIAWLVVEVPYWNWFNFPFKFIAISLADLMIAWFLAGLVIAKIIKSNNFIRM